MRRFLRKKAPKNDSRKTVRAAAPGCGGSLHSVACAPLAAALCSPPRRRSAKKQSPPSAARENRFFGYRFRMTFAVNVSAFGRCEPPSPDAEARHLVSCSAGCGPKMNIAPARWRLARQQVGISIRGCATLIRFWLFRPRAFAPPLATGSF